MSDDKMKVGEPDRSLIALGEDHEVRYWTGALSVSEDRLRAAVQKVGPSVEKVRQELGQ
ncbi:DUF3606 domain-containing protein [Caulobacter sp. 73W]|uniref:DUF3606 domain-containing protein n=1 Tax=Caulobacter sp. 73W TaxID=3161137 RepID=A0AB39KX47_9CAUL